MENIELASIVVGGLVTLAISFLKRWVTFEKNTIALLVLAISFLVVSTVFLIEKGFEWGEYLKNVAIVYSSSQAIYWIVMQQMGLGDKIEGV